MNRLSASRFLLRLLLSGIVLVAPDGARAQRSADFEAFRGQTIQEIRIAGNRITRDYVITREIWSEEGQPLDPATVAEDVTRLENLALFGSVVVTTTAAGEGVILDFEFTEMPWLVPYPAVKWNEQNGFSGGLGMSSPNFFGRGITLTANAVFGGATNVSFRGVHPWIAGDHLSIEVLAYHSERENTLLEYDEKSDRVEVTVGYHIGRFGRVSGNVGYWGVASDVDGITLDGDNRDDMAILGFSVGYDSRDSWRVPHRGWDARFVSEQLLGSADTRTATLDATRFQPLADRHTLALGPLVSLRSGEVGEQVPAYDQYFLGGSSSVRGFMLEDLGKQIQGKNRLLGSVEYRYLVMPVRAFHFFRWSYAIGFELATFADAGVIWSRPEQFNRDRTRFGYGAGVRVLLPVVEMMRFDVGVSEFGDVEFNFGLRAIFDARSLRTY